MLLVLTACSEFAILMSGSSLAVSQNAYSKAYSTIDFLTVVGTEKDIKTHFYESVIKYEDRRK